MTDNRASNIDISIIIPVYNTSKFLKECIDSLFSQTIAQRIQYVFINDASTDCSLQLLQKYKAKHPFLNIVVISNQKNSGLATTRNTGIKHAEGKYLMFVDSDDWIEPNMAETLLNEAITYDADIVTSAFYINTPTEQQVMLYNESERELDINSAPNDVLHFSLCNKIILRSLIVDNKLSACDSVNCWEDLSVTSRAIALAKRNVILNTPLYHYRKSGQESLSSANHKAILRDHLKYVDFLEEWFTKQGDDLHNKHIDFLQRLKFVAKIKMLRGDVVEISRWKNTYPDTNRMITKVAKQYSAAARLAFWAAAICPTPVVKLIASLIGKRAE